MRIKQSPTEANKVEQSQIELNRVERSRTELKKSGTELTNRVQQESKSKLTFGEGRSGQCEQKSPHKDPQR